VVLTILKNDGVRQWVSDDIPYMKWKIKHDFSTTDHQPDFRIFHIQREPTCSNVRKSSLIRRWNILKKIAHLACEMGVKISGPSRLSVFYSKI